MTILPPIKPEPLESLRARVFAALEPLRTRDCALDRQIAPGEERLHVFDFDDGVRLFLTKERIDGELKVSLETRAKECGMLLTLEEITVIHASASFEAESPIDAFINTGDMRTTLHRFRPQAWARLWTLLGLDTPQYQVPVDGIGGWPHWYVPLVMALDERDLE